MALINRPRKIVFIRHGESVRNAAKQGSVYFTDDAARAQIRGVPDHRIGITAFGEMQSTKTGATIYEHHGIPHVFYDTGYERTRLTREGILSAYPEEERSRIKLRSNSFLRERDAGYGYDMTKEEAERHFPWLDEHWKTKGGFLARPPGGESLADLSMRVQMFLDILYREHAEETVFLSIHGGTIRCLRFLLEDWTYEQFEDSLKGHTPANCGVTVYEYDESVGRLVLREYNTVYWADE
ncbi:MAG: phosphoglycerate mutase family protein [Candidatus Uhrbacteria bacterium]|nr:phosphoglycerate mutase family protein [Candidatus Uhrbacteria bacterium]